MESRRQLGIEDITRITAREQENVLARQTLIPPNEIINLNLCLYVRHHNFAIRELLAQCCQVKQTRSIAPVCWSLPLPLLYLLLGGSRFP